MTNYIRCRARGTTLDTPDERHTEVASMRDNWMTGLRERGISRKTRIAFLATRSVTYKRIYRVLLKRR